MDVFLIRHGRSTWNNLRKIQGHKNPRLAPEGKLAARRIGRRLVAAFGPFSDSDDVLLTSPLFRARETAQIISEILRLPLRSRLHLREACLGEWEGLSVDDIRRRDGARLRQWYRDPTRVRLSGGEPIPSFRRRVRSEMRRLLRQYGRKRRLILVTHGGWISTLLTDVVGIPLGRMWTFVVDNCSLTRLHWDGRKLYLRSFNESAGRPPGASAGTSSFRLPPRRTGMSSPRSSRLRKSQDGISFNLRRGPA
ncbi:histidine phosphatase family protein [bacterium]|nr:histidine phosphatase family protein [bacterium]